MKFLQCGTGSMQNAAMVVAIIDTVITSVLLILFVLGSSLMLAFKISGNTNNATRVLDIVTDDVFGTVEESYNKIRERKDVAEDMGVWLIVMFLTIVDFIISCIFLDGVRSKTISKVQTWLNIRIIIIVIFKIIVLINLLYGTSILHSIPDLVFTVYRIVGLYIGWRFLHELQTVQTEKPSVPKIELTPTTPPVECASFVSPKRKSTPSDQALPSYNESTIYPEVSYAHKALEKCTTSSLPRSREGSYVFEIRAPVKEPESGITNAAYASNNSDEENVTTINVQPCTPVPAKKAFHI